MTRFAVDTVALRKAMIDKGFFTISALSSATNVSRNTIGKVLDGTIRPSVDVMDKISSVLELSSENSGAIFFAEELRNT